jgi:hypothetical protein
MWTDPGPSLRGSIASWRLGPYATRLRRLCGRKAILHFRMQPARAPGCVSFVLYVVVVRVLLVRSLPFVCLIPCSAPAMHGPCVSSLPDRASAPHARSADACLASFLMRQCTFRIEMAAGMRRCPYSLLTGTAPESSHECPRVVARMRTSSVPSIGYFCGSPQVPHVLP